MSEFKVADQFKGLPMGDLIGGPLTATCDAQIKLATATSDFIRVVGFLPPPADAKSEVDRGAVRTALFKFTRPATTPAAIDPSKPIPTEDVTLEIPLLSLVKIPSLAITTVDITFDMEVKNSERSVEGTDAKAALDAQAKFGRGPVSGSVKISGSVPSHKENTRQNDQSAKYRVQVHAEDKGMSEGLARVLDIMQSSIAPKTIEPCKAAA